MSHRGAVVPASWVVGALLLAACGAESPLEGRTGSEVARLAADALEESGAVRMTGTVAEDGEEGEIDLQLQGDDAAGTITLGGTEIELISVDGTVYIAASAGFLTSLGLSTREAGEYEGRWVALPPSATEVDEFSLAGVADDLRSDDFTDETGSEELDGDDVVVAEHEDGSELVVADADPPLPLRTRADADPTGSVTFTGYGEETDISAPDDVVDLEELIGG